MQPTDFGGVDRGLAAFVDAARLGGADALQLSLAPQVAPRASLIEAVGVKLSSCHLPFPWVTRFSPRSARGRRMMGPGGRGVSICFSTCNVSSAAVPDSQRDRLTHRPHGNDAGSALVKRKLELFCSCRGLLAPAEHAAVGPHAMQDHRELASDGDAGPRYAAPLGHAQALHAQRGPSSVADQQGVRRLVERA